MEQNLPLENQTSITNLIFSVIQNIEAYASHIKNRKIACVGSYNNYFRIKKLTSYERLLFINNHLRVINHCYKSISHLEPKGFEANLLKYFIEYSAYKYNERIPFETKQNDIVEIYDNEGIQVFRNTEFFRISSYSIEDILTHEWWHLYERNVFMTQRIIKACSEIFEKNIQTPYYLNLNGHVVKEIWSPGESTCTMNQRLLFPLQRLGSSQSSAVINYLEVVDFKFVKKFTFPSLDLS